MKLFFTESIHNGDGIDIFDNNIQECYKECFKRSDCYQIVVFNKKICSTIYNDCSIEGATCIHMTSILVDLFFFKNLLNRLKYLI